jgi:3-hydroxyacyl-CoA dehydrogenase
MNQENGQSKFNPTLRPTAVIGGGTLGSRIALMLASSGGEVRPYDGLPIQRKQLRRSSRSAHPITQTKQTISVG